MVVNFQNLEDDMILIDGKKTADDIKLEIAEEVKALLAEGKKQPHLVAILVGHDGGSETYVAAKCKACEMCGFNSTLSRYEDDVTEAELLARIEELNNDDDVDGFIVQQIALRVETYDFTSRAVSGVDAHYAFLTQRGS